jgi:N-acetylmuramoyl-L-alanine amidase/putative methionine-R-sulfoxide reductase with GAF domain
MATTTPKFDLEASDSPRDASARWPSSESAEARDFAAESDLEAPPAQQNALQVLLAFSALHDQVRHRKALARNHPAFDLPVSSALPEFDPSELFVLDEVLKLVAERAVAITGADGLAIALAENNEIVLRAAAGTIRPDLGARIDRDSAFSGACFRTAQVVHCDDTETDDRVNREACRELGARSMVAVPLCGRRRVIGVLEAFSSLPFGFNDSDIRNLTLMAELVIAALKPEDEDRFAASAQVAATKLEAVTPAAAPVRETSEPIVPTHKEEIAVTAAECLPFPEKTSSSEETSTASPEIPSAAAGTPAVVEAQPTTFPLAVASDETPAATFMAPPATDEVSTGETKDTPSATPSEPEYLCEQPPAEPSHSRPVVFALLSVLLIGTAFAAGVWWKLHKSFLDDTIFNNKQSARIQQSVPPQPQAAAPKPAVPIAPTTASSTADTNSEATPDQSEAAPEDSGSLPRVSGVRHWSSPDSSTVVLDLEDQVQYEAHRLSGPDRIYFDLHDTRLAPELDGKSIDVGDAFLTRIRVAQPAAGMTRVVLEPKPGTDFSVSLEPNPYRLIVALHKTGTNPKGAVNLFPRSESETNQLAIVIPPPTKEDLQLRDRVPKMRIVVDAGHGGWDLGTVGKRGLLEKDLVLEIAQRLGKLLESRLGADVIYTRQDDNYIPLDQRAEIANQSQADLFVSVHANYSDLPSARGVETYYTNIFSAPGVKEAGANGSSLKETSLKNSGDPKTVPTLSAADLHDRIEQSRRLAASVQRSLYSALSVENPGLRDRGIKEAGFVVLTESAMPGILAEVSFVSSPTDEQKLRSDGYREQIAEALYKGIAHYAVNSRGVKLASASK